MNSNTTLVRVGSFPGGSLSIRVEGGEINDGVLTNGWTSATIKTTSDQGTRLFVIQPSSGTNESIEHGDRYVRGAFEIVKKINSTREAQAEWRNGR